MRVWVNGTFDVIHRGHLELLEFISSFGEVRVGIDTDERVKQLKGNDRPVNKCEDRIYFMSRIDGINSVVTFNTDDELCRRIEEWNPDLMIVGSDYKNKKIIGSHYVKQVLYFDRIGNYSSTNIINYGKSISDR